MACHKQCGITDLEICKVRRGHKQASKKESNKRNALPGVKIIQSKKEKKKKKCNLSKF